MYSEIVEVMCHDCGRVHTDKDMISIESEGAAVMAVCECGQELLKIE